MKAMIAGGGTGGHIFPALAIAQAIEQQQPGARIWFVGSSYGMEKELVPARGYPLLTLPIRGFHGKGIKGKLDLLWRLPASLLASLWILLRYRPKVVIGVGGYASAPLIWMAALLRIPTMIQEQNAIPGMVNRLSARFVKLACCGFPEAGKHLACPSITTGNPVRADFRQHSPWTVSRKTILILGGSQGSKSLNRILPQLLIQGLDRDRGLRVVHQCGRNNLDAVRQAYAGAAFEVEVTPFIDNMSLFMEDVLFAICRAGASTIAELKVLGIPAMLVPFPQAAHDHQTHNARSLANTGAAILKTEAELEQAGPELAALIGQPQVLETMARAMPKQNSDSAATCAAIALALKNRISKAEIIKKYEGYVS